MAIQGLVTDKNLFPQIGAIVQVKSTTKGAITNLNGVYTIDGVSRGQVLVFSAPGLKNREITVRNPDEYISVALQEDLLDVVSGEIYSWGDYAKKYNLNFSSVEPTRCPTALELRNKFPVKINKDEEKPGSYQIASLIETGPFLDNQCPPYEGITINKSNMVIDFKTNSAQKNLKYLALQTDVGKPNEGHYTAFIHNPIYLNVSGEIEIDFAHSFLSTGQTIADGCRFFIVDGKKIPTSDLSAILSIGYHSIMVELK